MARIQLLIADVDGTLVTGAKVLTAQARDAVARTRRAGIEFAITSGRPPRGMSMLVEPLGLNTPIAAFNGGMFVQPDLTTVIEQHTLPGAAAGEVVDYLLRAGLDVWVYRGTEWFVRDRDAPHVAREQATVQFAPSIARDLHGVLEGAVKVVGVSDQHALVERCEGALQRRLRGHASAARSQPYYLDVTHPEANKGNVVRVLARTLQIPPEHIATIGDMPNDVLMFHVSGMSIAMGNASADVRQAAHYVAMSNEQEGFANAVDQFVLGAPRGAG